MGNPIKKHPRIGDSNITVDDAIPAASVTGAMATATLRAKQVTSAIPTVPTAAGTTEVLLIAPGAGTLSVARVAFKDALVQHATNIVTFALVNKGAAGAGSTAMLAATDANTTKTSTGTAITAYGSRALTLHGTAGNLVVAAGDVLALQITGGGTLANTLTEGCVKLVFDQLA
jgi:hypothetical protein